MTPAPDEDRLLGDYRLKELVLETPFAYRWLAEQESIGRVVLVDELKPEMAERRESFLANVRAKAAIKHPLVASVYEAVDAGDECYYAHEYLSGGTLEARVEAGGTMKPTVLAHVLKRVAEVCSEYDANGRSSSPMSLEHLHYDAQGVLQIDNLVMDGERGARENSRDMSYLGRVLRPMVADGQPGSTRMQTLLSWMRGETLESPLTWQQVIELCELIEKQLSEPESMKPAASARVGGGKPKLLIVMVSVLALAVLMLAALQMRPEKTASKVEQVELPGPVTVAAGTATSAAGGEIPVAAFRIDAHEVTIGQYAEFLHALERLAVDGKQRGFDHAEQPADKLSHVPDDWDALWAAARSGGTWQGRLVTPDAPVVGVDWWDAWAYSEWKGGRLPTDAQWLAALGVEPGAVASIPAAGWGPVDPQTPDRSPHGVLNLAGSVCEWLCEPSASPAHPQDGPMWVLAGGSHMQLGSHALTREWVGDRGMRRPDAGFRLVYPVE